EISPAHHTDPGVTQGGAGSPGSVATAKAKSGSHLEAETEHPNILLGDIVTVPFQELYGVLSTLSPQQLHDLAAQLKSLPAGKDTNAKVTAFFKAWAHLDPIAALHGAADFKVSDAKTAAMIAQNWAAIDPAAALEWARAHSDVQGFQGAINGAINGWWSKDHAAAEQYVTAHANDSSGRQMATTLTSYIFSKDPERAKEW